MTYGYERSNSTNRSVGDAITGARMQDFNQELDDLFERMDSRDIDTSYDVQWRLIQVVDNINLITVDIDRSDRNATIPKIYIQEQWDTNKFTITYSWSAPSTIIYWP